MKEVLKFKSLVENGKYMPEEVLERLEAKANKTDQEVSLINRWKVLSADRKEKIDWLMIEAKWVEADLALKDCLDLNREPPNIHRSVEILEELCALNVAPLMLKKQPQVVHTMFKLCSYSGLKASSEEIPIDAEKIQNLAMAIVGKFQGCFDVPEGRLFDDFFIDEVKRFRQSVMAIPAEKLKFMTCE